MPVEADQVLGAERAQGFGEHGAEAVRVSFRVLPCH